MKPALRLGFGCSGPWGEKWFSREKAAALIEQALREGITFFDTGHFYCGGEAERRLGQALEKAGAVRADITLSTKIGKRRMGRDYVRDFSHQAVDRDIKASLAQLQTGYLDLVYLHGPGEDEAQSALACLEPLRTKGIIRRIGLCSDHPSLRKWVVREEIDAVMAPFNLLDRTFLPIFKEAKAAGKHTAAIAPLAQGLYRKGFSVPKSLPDLWYIARARLKNPQALRDARKLEWLHHYDGWQASELALAFVLAHSCIDVAVTTTTRQAHLRENCAAALRRLPEEAMNRIRELSR